MTRIKVCGVTTINDARMLVELGVDCIGLNFWPKSKRYVEFQQASAIAAEIRSQQGDTQIVGVFVNQSRLEIAEAESVVGLDWIQLHGDEDVKFSEYYPGRCIRALPLSCEEDLDSMSGFPDCILLVDSQSVGRGGSGVRANWQLAAQVSQQRKIWLAGGLSPGNVSSAIAAVAPYGVDVASGVESSPGIKNPDLVTQFVAEVRGMT